MPILLGLILVIALTIAGAYEFDSTTGRVPNGLSSAAAGGQAPMVNWNVVSDDWHDLTANLHSKAQDLEKSLKQHTG
jgi:hypothetical protein